MNEAPKQRDYFSPIIQAYNQADPNHNYRCSRLWRGKYILSIFDVIQMSNVPILREIPVIRNPFERKVAEISLVPSVSANLVLYDVNTYKGSALTNEQIYEAVNSSNTPLKPLSKS